MKLPTWLSPTQAAAAGGGATVGFMAAGPLGAAVGAAVGYFGGKYLAKPALPVVASSTAAPSTTDVPNMAATSPAIPKTMLSTPTVSAPGVNAQMARIHAQQAAARATAADVAPVISGDVTPKMME